MTQTLAYFNESRLEDIGRAYLLDAPRGNVVQERREAPRYKITMPVVITSLDEHFQPRDLQYHGITRDISLTGVGVITSSPLTPFLVSLRFVPANGQEFEALARVVYCNPVGYYFHSGCEFVAEPADQKTS